MTNCIMCDDTGYKDHAGFSMDPCDHAEAPRWDQQFDNADVCEVCGQLTAGVRLYGRASLAITFLYTHAIITESERDKARQRIKALAGK